MPYAVFLLEDHPITRQGFVSLLQNQPDLGVCGVASSRAEAAETLAAANPDLLIADLTLPDGNALDVIRAFRRTMPALRILVVSMHDEKLYAEPALDAGAQGYLMKIASFSELLDAIRRVLQGQIYLSAAMQTYLLERHLHEPAQSPPFSLLSRLSPREREVFEGLGQGWSTHEIAAHLSISPHTVGTYRQRIKRKMGLPTSMALMRHAMTWVEGKVG